MKEINYSSDQKRVKIGLRYRKKDSCYKDRILREGSRCKIPRGNLLNKNNKNILRRGNNEKRVKAIIIESCDCITGSFLSWMWK
ncbi:hypothetical protein [Anaerosolibacter sp.]|uniref:hypothetical protein n=1 Tax=Anaerosolibacter sp. TaxID=1872527 RepID=UPI0039F012CE